MELRHSVYVVGDRKRKEELRKRYGFIDELNGGIFTREEQGLNADFLFTVISWN